MTEGDCQVFPKNLLEKLQDLLEKQPEICDVTFYVGPQRKLVRSLKAILKAASPVFKREFEERWEVGIIKEGKGIPLPNFDGNAFELFIKLTTLDTWNLTTLKSLNLPPNDILNLMTICRHFGITDGLKNLTEIFISFFRSFHGFEKSNDFLQMSRENLQTVLAHDKISLTEWEIFQVACGWAFARCKERNVKPSVENMRLVLGSCLFEIRFPLMSVGQFTKARQFQNILTAEESLRIYEHIGLYQSKQAQLDFHKSNFMFETKPRLYQKSPLSLNNCKILCLTNELKIVDDRPIECNEKENLCHLISIPTQRIAIHGLGFLGPIDEDAFYNVTCSIRHKILGTQLHEKKQTDRIWAEKGKIFYWIFDQPITVKLEQSCILRPSEQYTIAFSLQGPPTISVKREISLRYQDDKGLTGFIVEFSPGWNTQLIEILYNYV